MSFSHCYRLKLLARNEGKIKSYESCVDIRAWSHDAAIQDRYLREWMRSDMPVCVLHLSTVLSFFQGMNNGKRGRATSRCHPNCKSKVILESINNSCIAMKECLKADKNFEKFFVEEDLETSHWPCDKCLDALRNIKMFWKILLQKIFNINITKANVLDDDSYTCSVQNVANSWQKDMIEQAVFVKALTPELACTCGTGQKGVCNCKKSSTKDSTKCNCSKTQCMYNVGDGPSRLSRKTSGVTLCAHETQTSNENCSFSSLKDTKTPRERRCRYVSVKVETACVACSTPPGNCVNFDTYKICLEQRENEKKAHKLELEKFKKENATLKKKLESFYQWKSSMLSSAFSKKDLCPYKLVPNPFEDITSITAKDTESEMIITMQNCKNESFRHVSLLQVLHKTNEPLLQEILPVGPCKRANPIHLLTKVQTTLGEMVKREISRAYAENRSCDQISDIEANFHQLDLCKSMPSCSGTTSMPSSYCTIN